MSKSASAEKTYILNNFLKNSENRGIRFLCSEGPIPIYPTLDFSLKK